MHRDAVGPHECALERVRGMPNFNDTCRKGIPVSGLMQEQWNQILDVNCSSRFKIAVNLLQGIASIEHANRALGVMVRTAERIHSIGIADYQELFEFGGADNGSNIHRVFQICLSEYHSDHHENLKLVPESDCVDALHGQALRCWKRPSKCRTNIAIDTQTGESG